MSDPFAPKPPDSRGKAPEIFEAPAEPVRAVNPPILVITGAVKDEAEVANMTPFEKGLKKFIERVAKGEIDPEPMDYIAWIKGSLPKDPPPPLTRNILGRKALIISASLVPELRRLNYGDNLPLCYAWEDGEENAIDLDTIEEAGGCVLFPEYFFLIEGIILPPTTEQKPPVEELSGIEIPPITAILERQLRALWVLAKAGQKNAFLRQRIREFLETIDMAEIVLDNKFQEQMIQFFLLVAKGELSPRDYDLQMFMGNQVGKPSSQRKRLTRTELGETAAIIRIEDIPILKKLAPGVQIILPDGTPSAISYAKIIARGGWVIFKEDLGDYPPAQEKKK